MSVVYKKRLDENFAFSCNLINALLVIAFQMPPQSTVINWKIGTFSQLRLTLA